MKQGSEGSYRLEHKTGRKRDHDDYALELDLSVIEYAVSKRLDQHSQ